LQSTMKGEVNIKLGSATSRQQFSPLRGKATPGKKRWFGWLRTGGEPRKTTILVQHQEAESYDQ